MKSATEMRVFVDETVDEMKKVTWPDWAQLKNATLVILAFVILVSAIIWLMDVVVRNLLDLILGMFVG